jgi:AmmeMemoRadiSam system protein B
MAINFDDFAKSPKVPICNRESFETLSVNSAKQSHYCPDVEQIATALRASQWRWATFYEAVNFEGRIMKCRPVFIVFALSLLLVTSRAHAQDKGVREPILPDQGWYPKDPDKLRSTIEDYLAKAEVSPVKGGIVGTVVPHAGHIYSGHVAAYAYRLIRGMDFKRVILIGPSHHIPFRGVSANQQSGYKTPLGVVPVDQVFARKLLEADSIIKWVPEAHAVEHSLEIQIPFLQVVLKNFQIVPILMGQQDYDTCTRLAEALSKAMAGDQRKTLLLASTDLSHFHTDQQARVLDHKFIEHVKEFDPKGLYQSLASGTCEACGGGPVVAAMLASMERGATRCVVLNYANSGDVTGDRSQVVGYVSALFVKEP